MIILYKKDVPEGPRRGELKKLERNSGGDTRKGKVTTTGLPKGRKQSSKFQDLPCLRSGI